MKSLGNLIISEDLQDLHKESDEGRGEELQSDIMIEFKKKQLFTRLKGSNE